MILHNYILLYQTLADRFVFMLNLQHSCFRLTKNRAKTNNQTSNIQIAKFNVSDTLAYIFHILYSGLNIFFIKLKQLFHPLKTLSFTKN